ncbi:hypothetical protein [Streptomyces sp. NBC_01294]|uniref:hypothetical protein n=1 Tax=Streptomyces sp. NBC_01294 TaxID=2903815 RepID=UPI002DDC6B91|nr:hypothetical protein [Streptomyces sp. NBC_01294]WRZ62366.1 hypothetical protein OG534_37985 [Streptomyces sp. NBC_01294]
MSAKTAAATALIAATLTACGNSADGARAGASPTASSYTVDCTDPSQPPEKRWGCADPVTPSGKPTAQAPKQNKNLAIGETYAFSGGQKVTIASVQPHTRKWIDTYTRDWEVKPDRDNVFRVTVSIDNQSGAPFELNGSFTAVDGATVGGKAESLMPNDPDFREVEGTIAAGRSAQFHADFHMRKELGNEVLIRFDWLGGDVTEAPVWAITIPAS